MAKFDLCGTKPLRLKSIHIDISNMSLTFQGRSLGGGGGGGGAASCGGQNPHTTALYLIKVYGFITNNRTPNPVFKFISSKLAVRKK